MGEVYRARDEKLNRDVAVKVLPADLSENAERLLRFEQEAQAAGSLNHPNILAVYDVGVHDRSPYVVAELLEGETLRELLEQRQPATRKSIDYAIQLAHGLAAAHDKGIVHRDIKPDNIFLTKDERVKILDFGLAKLVQPSGEDVAQTEIATRKVRTDPGTVMGTVGYMSPEQVRGQATDHRTDIFSFGAVLYEMLSRCRAFHGDSAIETLNAILKEEPAELSSSNPNIASGLERVVWHCLEKSPERRFQSATDIAFALESLSGITSHPSQQTLTALRPHVSSSSTWTRERLVWLGLCALLVVAVAALAFSYFSRAQPSSQPIRLALTTSDMATFPYRITVSPDGSRVVFIASNAEGKRLLWVRSLDSLTAQPLAGTDGAVSPFWSPDSHFIGYFVSAKLYKIDASGGSPQALCDVGENRGGTWNRDGVILFGGSDGLHRVSAQGGNPTLATKVDAKEEAHRWPYFLPDGRHFVFLADAETTENHQIRLGSLDSQDTRILFGAVTPVAYAPGYLLYVSQGALVARAFDTAGLKVTGDPVTVAEHVVEVGDNHEFDFSGSDNGVLAYQSGSAISQFVWFDRTGKKLAAVAEPDSYASIARSPDGKRAVAGLLDADGRPSDLWMFDLSRGSKTRLTFDPQSEDDPVWSPDGNSIAFSSNRAGDGHAHLYMTSAGSTGDDQLLLSSDSDDYPSSWSRDGQNILFLRYASTGHAGTWVLSLSGDRQPKPLLQAASFDQTAAQFSPDGHLIAYQSNETGRPEVYVQTFPLSGRKAMVSSDGGGFPLWRDDGKELFYVTGAGRIMSAEIETAATLESSVPRELFQTNIKFTFAYPYAVTPDGARFLINTPADANNPAPLILVLNWTAILKQKH